MTETKPTIIETAPGVWLLAGRGRAELRRDTSPIASIKFVAIRDDGARFYGANEHEALAAAYVGSEGRTATWSGPIVSWGKAGA